MAEGHGGAELLTSWQPERKERQTDKKEPRLNIPFRDT
jgi:hypothetical protein